VTRIKICGINSAEAIDAAVEAGADWVGLNFFPPSPRYVTPAQAAALSARHADGPRRVGLFVDPTDAEIAATLDAVALDIIQLHATPGRASDIRARFGRPVWRAVGIAAAADLPVTSEGADAILLDAKPPKDATRPGGNAARFDWSLLAGWHPGFPWLLAGGLTPENVADAIRATNAPAVDVSSGVESAKGVKDPARIRAFIAAVRRA
jgi:phosphoribosylanthranilate isomerase